MKIYHSIEELSQIIRPVISIGTFDGVHVGYQKVFEKMNELAHLINGSSMAVSFDPHPGIIFDCEGKNFHLLNSLEEKIKLIQKSGIEHLLLLPFNEKMSLLTAEDFIQKVILEKIKPDHIVVGYGHTFGKDRCGDFIDLKNFAIEKKFKMTEVAPQKRGKSLITSEKIRELLTLGSLDEANLMLGYPYFFSGEVVRGNQIGKLIGYPTANIHLDEPQKLIPKNGVYICDVHWRNNTFYGMANIGFRPTLNGTQLTVEANIFDFDQDIYNETIQISLLHYLREEKKFGSLDLLKVQLLSDKDSSKLFLKEKHFI